MKWGRGLLALAACLAAQIVLGRLAPRVHGSVDLLMLPMAWYALRGAQRSSMLAGCAGGLLQDAWFEPGLFGVSGFSKTLAGWALGGLGSRFDLNATWARATAGFVLPAVERLVTSGLRRLFDQATASTSVGEVLLHSALGGLLIPAVFAILDRVGPGRGTRAPGRRLG